MGPTKNIKNDGPPVHYFDVTVKNTLLMLQKSGFKLRKIVKVYHLGVMKLLSLAPAYIFITRKVGRKS
jgi:hypothetical protein